MELDWNKLTHLTPIEMNVVDKILQVSKLDRNQSPLRLGLQSPLIVLYFLIAGGELLNNIRMGVWNDRGLWMASSKQRGARSGLKSPCASQRINSWEWRWWFGSKTYVFFGYGTIIIGGFILGWVSGLSPDVGGEGVISIPSWLSGKIWSGIPNFGE